MKVVLTTGVFDLLHPGHLYLLEKAKSLGDYLIVGINSDSSAAKLKGATRPIYNQYDRAELLMGLKVVDKVRIFKEKTPAALIRELKPDVFVKGGDYTLDTLPEAQTVFALGGQIFIIPRLPDYSTTNVIERIKNA